MESEVSLVESCSERNRNQLESSELVLVGNPGTTHVGRHLWTALQELGVHTHFCDSEQAYRANPIVSKFNWWLRGHRPAGLLVFGRQVSDACITSGARYLLTTGLA